MPETEQTEQVWTGLSDELGEKFELVAENQLGNEAFATPVACGGRLYLRVADNTGGKRQETLYCIGE